MKSKHYPQKRKIDRRRHTQSERAGVQEKNCGKSLTVSKMSHSVSSLSLYMEPNYTTSQYTELNYTLFYYIEPSCTLS